LCNNQAGETGFRMRMLAISNVCNTFIDTCNCQASVFQHNSVKLTEQKTKFSKRDTEIMRDV